ncbi:Synaptotagmin-3 [Sesamum angolense]|uniref:Synaptotagmin-3 n=1 Tax=Sesamum angolense TaxID=2727404 RepID=A0AAE2BHV7_9LAMI|nr:Synaptotagmin-3 [Sesamum angolense]
MGFLSSLLEFLVLELDSHLVSLLGFTSSFTLNQKKMLRPLCELDTVALEELMPEIPPWVKNPDYDRVDWLNKFISDMWPFLDKESLGHVDISLADVVYNGRINQKYHLIDSKDGVIHIELRWKTI